MDYKNLKTFKSTFVKKASKNFTHGWRVMSSVRGRKRLFQQVNGSRKKMAADDVSGETIRPARSNDERWLQQLITGRFVTLQRITLLSTMVLSTYLS